MSFDNDIIIYLDHAATTPIRKEVLEQMQPYLKEQYGNPGGIYRVAVEAKKAINQSRRKIATAIGADPTEVFFTSGGTEADNWAIKGVAFAKMIEKKQPIHIITSAFEHHAVLETCAFLEKLGVEVTYVKPTVDGYVSPEAIEAAIKPYTVLISVMLANNEIGTIQPIEAIAKIAHDNQILMHTDAVQAMGHIPVNVKSLAVDLLSVSGHKFGAPKGVGFLYIKQGTVIESFMNGGGQERGRRASTENVASIVGMAAAYDHVEDSKKIRSMRDELEKGILTEIPDSELNGSALGGRLPGTINVSFRGVDSEALVLRLNRHGICVSGGSACTTSVKSGSHVILALGKETDMAKSALRITIGEENTPEELDYTLQKIKAVVAELRELRYE